MRPWFFLVALLCGCDFVFGLKDVSPAADAAPDTALPPGMGWKATATGWLHTCGLREDSTLWCWGSNEFQETGTGVPERVIAAPTQIGTGLYASLSSTHQHTCAIDLEGGLWCWGANDFGQLGTGNLDIVPTPRRIDGTWKSVAAGAFQTCAIRDDATLWCWGRNTWGQLGLGSQIQTVVPTQVGVDKWQSVDTAYFQTCGIQTDSTLWCWGENTYGVVGDGTSSLPVTSPRPSAPGSWKSVNVGVHVACAIQTNDQLRCWGYGGYGSRGDGTTNVALTPLPVSVDGKDVADWVSVSLDYLAACGTRQNGSIWCWGNNNHSELGVASAGYQALSPVELPASNTWKLVDTGALQTCAIDDTNALYCWGSQGRGQLGNGATNHAVPVQMPKTVGTLSGIAAGDNHTCGIDATGAIACGGYNAYGQLGDATYASRSLVVGLSAPLAGVTQVAPGNGHTCAVNGTGTYCWGNNSRGQLGNTTTTASFTPVLTGGVLSKLASSEHSCGTASDGTIYCWGANSFGQVGNNTTTDVLTPTNVGNAMVALDVGGYHTCVIAIPSAAYCWGRGTEGQLGTGAFTNALTPIPVATSSTGDLSKLSAGELHTCAIATSGLLWCWGSSASGQLGLGDRTPRALPTVIGSATWKSVGAGGGHTCGVRTDGTLWCWGRNTRGQLGIGTTLDRYVPTQVGTDTDWIDVVAGLNHTCATKAGDYWCWGGNEQGESPDGTSWTATPTRVP